MPSRIIYPGQGGSDGGGSSPGGGGETALYDETLFISDGAAGFAVSASQTNPLNASSMSFFSAAGASGDIFNTGNGIWSNANPTEINVPAGASSFEIYSQFTLGVAGSSQRVYVLIDSSQTSHSLNHATATLGGMNAPVIYYSTIPLNVGRSPCTPGDIIEMKYYKKDTTSGGIYDASIDGLAGLHPDRRTCKLRILFYT